MLFRSVSIAAMPFPCMALCSLCFSTLGLVHAFLPPCPPGEGGPRSAVTQFPALVPPYQYPGVPWSGIVGVVCSGLSAPNSHSAGDVSHARVWAGLGVGAYPPAIPASIISALMYARCAHDAGVRVPLLARSPCLPHGLGLTRPSVHDPVGRVPPGGYVCAPGETPPPKSPRSGGSLCQATSLWGCLGDRIGVRAEVAAPCCGEATTVLIPCGSQGRLGLISLSLSDPVGRAPPGESLTPGGARLRHASGIAEGFDMSIESRDLMLISQTAYAIIGKVTNLLDEITDLYAFEGLVIVN